ncbi:hypothetical protein AB0M50_56275, partial [Nonomuraea fuscirosea]
MLSPIDALREQVTARLSAFDRRQVPPAGGVRRAGVTVCVLEDAGGGPYVIVIRRAARGRNPGQGARHRRSFHEPCR